MGSASPPDPAGLRFGARPDGSFSFNTGVLEGTLRPGGKSLGLTSVIHRPSGQRLDSSNGLLSHYRVFSHGTRYGGGAWDWPSTAYLEEDGAVGVRWAAVEARPFRMEATYRWRDRDTIDLVTRITPERDLSGLESFVASYFTREFAESSISSAGASGGKPSFVPAWPSEGYWQMFPRDDQVLTLIRDGRWKLEPNPVEWTLRGFLAQPVAFRRQAATGLTAVLMSPSTDCFAIATPHQEEPHDSLYFSLFGSDVKSGVTVSARVRLVVGVGLSEAQILERYERFRRELGSERPSLRN